jgi:hypothetical protein
LDFGFRELGMIPEVTYLLGFSPDAVLPDGKYHKLRVKLIAADYPYVQARPGYVAPTKEEAEKPALESKLDQEAFANDDLTEVPVGTLTQPGKSESGEPILWVVVKIDVKHLQFDRNKDRQDQKLTFVMALFDKQGNFVTGKQGEMNFAFKRATFDHFAQTGLSAKIFLQAPPGSYRLRTVTQEATDGKMSASTFQSRYAENAEGCRGVSVSNWPRFHPGKFYKRRSQEKTLLQRLQFFLLRSPLK